MKTRKYMRKSELGKKNTQKATKKQHGREKEREKEGKFMEVPDYLPKTSIFIKKGQDPKKVFRKFKIRRGVEQ